jgi:hypothetical protein
MSLPSRVERYDIFVVSSDACINDATFAEKKYKAGADITNMGLIVGSWISLI